MILTWKNVFTYLTGTPIFPAKQSVNAKNLQFFFFSQTSAFFALLHAHSKLTFSLSRPTIIVVCSLSIYSSFFASSFSFWPDIFFCVMYVFNVCLFFLEILHWNVFSSSQGLKIGSVVGYSILCRVRFRVPSPFLLENENEVSRINNSLFKSFNSNWFPHLSGYVASMIGSWSLMGFSRLLGVTMN